MDIDFVLKQSEIITTEKFVDNIVKLEKDLLVNNYCKTEECIIRFLKLGTYAFWTYSLCIISDEDILLLEPRMKRMAELIEVHWSWIGEVKSLKSVKRFA